MNRYNIIDLFAGCGGLSDGFEKAGNYNLLAALEWENAPARNLANRLKKKWQYSNADDKVLVFDIQRTEELFKGWENDPVYGTHNGLNTLVNDSNIDVIIGGPPCQAYSVAGRVRDKDGMKNDYRNYLFEGYMKIVQYYRPKAFIFENVQGMLSAKPGGVPVINLIKEQIKAAGYEVIDDLQQHALIDLTEYGVPQNRKRVIILGINKSYYKNPEKVLADFYDRILPAYKERKRTVRDTIGDLSPLFPFEPEYKEGGRKYSHFPTSCNVSNHTPRFHSKRDIDIFHELAKDIEDGNLKYTSAESLKQLYTQRTGNTSNVHKYYVLRWDEQSNTIPAHLYKDGLRHIHPDSRQSRSITVREAARLQTFDDDFEFISSNGDNYKMIGNAVPPMFSEKLANALKFIISDDYILASQKGDQYSR